MANGDVKKIDSISDVPYRIGYSFRNPTMLKPVTRTRERPYFAMDWAGSVDQVKSNFDKRNDLKRFPTVWRRSAKSMAVAGLGVVGNRRELPSFQELGAAPGPTDVPTVNSSVVRDVLGFLQNGLTTIGGQIDQSQKMEILRAQAQGPYATSLPNYFTPGSGGLGMVGWLAILGTLGAGAYFYMKRA